LTTRGTEQAEERILEHGRSEDRALVAQRQAARLSFLPDLVPKDRVLARGLLALHLTLNFTLFSLVCVHTAAALKHHFIDRDTVLTRMLPSWRSAFQGKGPR